MSIDKPLYIRPVPDGTHAVTDKEANKPRILVVWVEPTTMEEFDAQVELCKSRGYVVLNDADEIGTRVAVLRDYLHELASATHLCLPPTWWTSVVAHQLVTIAGWMGIKLVDDNLKRIETVGGKR